MRAARWFDIMNCPACGAPLRGPFCAMCGTPAPPSPHAVCPACGAPAVGRFCNLCGALQPGFPPPAAPPPAYPPYPVYYPAYPPRPPGEGFRELGSVTWSFGLAVFAAAMLISVATLLYVSGTMIAPGIASAAPACGGVPCGAVLYVVSPIPPFIHYVAAPLVGGPFMAYFVALLVVILLAVLAQLWDVKRLAATVRRPLGDFQARFRTKSAWATVGQLWMAALFLQFIIAIAIGVPDDPVGGASSPDWYLYFALEQASVHEEIVTRVMFIGLPLALFSAASVRWLDPGPGASRRALSRVLGGGIHRGSPRALLAASLVTLIFSSLVFGLAHVPEWGWWKFFPTFFAGLAMGYVFLRHGIAAAILFHFVNDYFIASTLLLQDNLAAFLLLGILLLIILGLGAVYLVLYIVHSIDLAAAVSRRLRKLPEPAAVPEGWAAPIPIPGVAYAPWPPPYLPPPPTEGYPAPPPPDWARPFFACPRCGGVEASFADGRFTCLSCGNVL